MRVCDHCGQPGVPYTYRDRQFDGLFANRGQKLCERCLDHDHHTELNEQVVADSGGLQRLRYSGPWDYEPAETFDGRRLRELAAARAPAQPPEVQAAARHHPNSSPRPTAVAADDYLTPNEETALYDTLRRGARKRRGITGSDLFDGTWDDIDELLNDLDFERAHWLRPAPPPSSASQPPGSGHASPGAAGGSARRPAARHRCRIELPPPATDAEFLDICTSLGTTLQDVADQVSEWAGELVALGLPPPVLAPLADVGGCMAAAAISALQAARAFRGAYKNAHEVAAHGLRITGDGAA